MRTCVVVLLPFLGVVPSVVYKMAAPGGNVCDDGVDRAIVAPVALVLGVAVASMKRTSERCIHPALLVKVIVTSPAAVGCTGSSDRKTNVPATKFAHTMQVCQRQHEAHTGAPAYLECRGS